MKGDGRRKTKAEIKTLIQHLHRKHPDGQIGCSQKPHEFGVMRGGGQRKIISKYWHLCRRSPPGHNERLFKEFILLSNLNSATCGSLYIYKKQSKIKQQ